MICHVTVPASSTKIQQALKRQFETRPPTLLHRPRELEVLGFGGFWLTDSSLAEPTPYTPKYTSVCPAMLPECQLGGRQKKLKNNLGFAQRAKTPETDLNPKP